MKNLVPVSSQTIKKIDSLKWTQEEITERARDVPTQDLRQPFLEAKTLVEFGKKVIAGVREVFIERAPTEAEQLNGNRVIYLPKGTVDIKARHKKVLNPEKVKEILEPKGLYEKVLTTIIDEEMIKNLSFSDDISEKELKAMYERTESGYIVIVR